MNGIRNEGFLSIFDDRIDDTTIKDAKVEVSVSMCDNIPCNCNCDCVDCDYNCEECDNS